MNPRAEGRLRRHERAHAIHDGEKHVDADREVRGRDHADAGGRGRVANR
jgi:hypothetical protein